ncbi:MAG: HEAT repeat domain-containing protein [bacterium]|nr:HEAT repeat domain-containing protein [bacterium]
MIIDLEEKDSLRFILKHKSKDYYFKLFSVLNEVDKVATKEDVIYRAQHGNKHCESVEKNINDLLPIILKRKMEPDDIFSLLLSVWFHDVGELFDDKGKDFTYIRSHDYVYKHYEDWKLAESEAHLIMQILEATHHEMQEETAPEVAKDITKIKFFSCLLRLADKLDIGYGNVPRELLTPWEKSFKTRTVLLVLKERFDIVTNIDSEHWLISATMRPNLEIADNKEFINDIYEKIKMRLNKDLDTFKGIFYQNGLGYQEIKLILPPKIKEESAVVREKPWQGEPSQISPYKFLENYETTDKEIFKGRDQDISKFVGHILINKLLVIYGEPWIGKTSLIKAGIILQLRDRNVVVCIDCDDNPLNLIKETIEKEFKRDRVRSFKLDKSLSLVEFFKNIELPFSIIIFIDHFENFFKQVPQKAREHFMDEISAATCADKPLVKFIFSVRKDFFVQLGSFKDRLPELFQNAFELTRLTESQAIEALTSPAKLFNIEYAKELQEALIWDIKDEHDLIRPVHLQIVGNRLVETLSPDLLKDILPQGITYEWYDNLGGVQGILSDYLEETIKKMNELSAEEKEQAKGILKVMVTSFDTHPQMNVREICAFIKIEEEDRLSTILTSLVHCRLLRKLKKETYELTSDYLINSITKKWLTRKDIELREIIEHVNKALDDWRAHRWHMDITLISKAYLYREDLPLQEDALEILLYSSLEHHFPLWFWLKKLDPDKARKIIIDAIKTTDGTGIRRIIDVLGKEGILVLDHLILRLNDPDAQIRKAVIEVLGYLKDSRTIDSLVHRLSDSDAEVRDIATVSLSNFGTPKIVETFIAELDNPDWRIRKAAADGLGVLKTPKSLESLFKKINDPDSEVRKAVVSALGKLGNIKAQTPLIRRLKDSHAEVREAAAKALGESGNSLCVEEIMSCFHDKIWKVREQAAIALGKLGDERALDPLLEMADDPDTDVRRAASEALGNLHTPKAMQILLDRLQEQEWWKKETAAIALGYSGQPKVLDTLLEGLDDPDWRIRVAMINGLRSLGISELKVEEALIKRLQDPHEEVRRAAIIALGSLGTEKALTSIIPCLNDLHVYVRQATALTLGMLGNLGVLEPLLEGLNDSEDEVKNACLEALQKIDERFYRKDIE